MGAKKKDQAAPVARRKALTAVAERFAAFRPAVQVLTSVRAVRTRFVQFDHATRVGGLPIERFMLLHGPSNHGKSLWALGLIDSFLALNHFALYVDAERTTPITWVKSLMGTNAEHPHFFAIRPVSYEQTIADVRNFLNNLIAAREAGEVPEDTSAIIIVDSLRKLVPKDLMKAILAEAKVGDITGGKDRKGQIQAKMNAAWMDELVPLLEKAQAGFVAIAREMQDPDADMWAKKFGTDYKLGGGSNIFFDASLVMRVERAGWVTDREKKKKGDGEDDKKKVKAKVFGERHRVTIRKTKVAGKDDKQVVCFYHSSNGQWISEGFDRARDVMELAEQFGLVTKKGAAYWQGERKIANGENNAVRVLSADVARLAALEQDVRAMFEKKAPMTFDEDGVVEDEQA